MSVRTELSDDELVDLWEAQALGGTGVSHLDHVRIAWVLVRRVGAAEAEERLVIGTMRGCNHYGVPERFDEALTRRWAKAIAAATAVSDAEAFEDFVEAFPDLRRGDLYGPPVAAQE